jgi:hypothetical protein
MTRALCLALAVFACGGKVAFPAAHKHATDQNVTAHDHARDELLLKADGAPFDPLLAVVEMNQHVTETGGILGLRPGEELYALPDGEIALMPKTCIRGSSCGCEVSREYSYLKKPDGSVVVARLTPVVSLREIRVASCSTGCDTPPPPALQSAARLGVRQVTAIRFEEATYPYELVVETCDHPGQRP